MDDSSYVAGGANVVSTNTKIATSAEDLAAISKKTADAQVAAILKVREASKLRISNLQNIAASAPNLETQTAATVALQREQGRLARTYGETTVASRGFSNASKEGERDLNKLVRGGLAGSGALSALGRSLAFASTGFIAFATGATVIKASITAAQDEAVAQKQVAAQLKTSDKSFKEYGGQIDSVLLKESHLAGFTKAKLLTAFGFLVRIGGNVQKSLHLTALAADVARARSISLQSASIALAKALGGSATALRRLGIIVPKNVSTTQALAFVTQKFAGQAEAGTTASEKFHATLVDTGAVIGKALLPTFNRLATSLSNWLAKMNESGRLQKDVNSIVKDAGDIFHTFAGAIKLVDDATGGFKRTLEILIGLKFASIVASWIGPLEALAARWGLVAKSAQAAGAAQTAALGTGAAAAGSGGAAIEGAAAGGLLSGGLAGRLASRARYGPSAAAVKNVSMYTTEAEASGTAAVVAGSKLSKLGSNIGLVGLAAALAIPRLQKLGQGESSFIGGHLGGTARNIFDRTEGLFTGGVIGKNPFAGLFGGGGKSDANAIPVKLVNAPGFGNLFGGRKGVGSDLGPFGTAKPIAIFKSFTDTIGNQLAQARAALTKGTQDDVAAAKAEIAQIKKEIAAGHLKGAALIQALQAEAGAVSTIQSAEAAAAQKRAAAAQALKAKILARIEASIDPLKLEVQLSKDQADNAGNKKIVRDLKAIRNAARKALASGNLSLAQQKEAYDQITQLNQQIAAANKKNAQATSKAGHVAYKQLNQAKFLGGLDLTPAQRKALRQRLAQVGPGGTVGSDRVGAYGYQIGDNGRPIHVHTRVDIDGHKVAENTTRHQQRRRRRNSSQRRGPVAGDNG